MAETTECDWAAATAERKDATTADSTAGSTVALTAASSGRMMADTMADETVDCSVALSVESSGRRASMTAAKSAEMKAVYWVGWKAARMVEKTVD